MRTPVTIVVPSYNTWWLLDRCLRTLVRFGIPGQQIVVVDDGSTDDSRRRLAQTPEIDVAFTARNRGFAGACNVGAALATSPVLLFLNADIEVLPGAVEAMTAALADRTVGIVGAKLLYPEGGVQHAGLIVDRDGNLRHAHWMRPDALPDSDLARDYPVVTGAALAIRAEEFDAWGRFDEGYLNGFEDAELCMRAWTAGRRVRYEPRARFVHVESASPERFAHDDQNYRRFMSRWGTVLRALPRAAAPERTGTSLAGNVEAVGAGADEARRLARTINTVLPEARSADAPPFTLRFTVGGVDPTDFVAPANAREAAAIAQRSTGERYFTATWRAFDLLVAAGIPVQRVDVARAGIAVPDRPPRRPDLVVSYVSDVTSAPALRLALETWRAVRGTLEPLGVRYELRVALSEDPLRALFATVLNGAAPELADVPMIAVAGDATGDDVLDGAGTLLVTGPTDRVDRIPLLAMATGVDVVATADQRETLALIAGEDAFLCADASALGGALVASFGPGRADRVAQARRDVGRRHTIDKARLRLTILLARRDASYDDLHGCAVVPDRFPRERAPAALAVHA